MSEGKTTTDHDEIRQWAEERGGVPASVKGTEKGKKDDAGILRLDFEPRDEALEEISWEEFFEKFDKEKLAFLYQEETAKGETSRFHKFINRPAGGKSGGSGSSASKSSGGSKSASSAKSSGGSKGEGGGKSSGGSKSEASGRSSGGSKSEGGGKSSGSPKSESGGKSGGAKSSSSGGGGSKKAGGKS